MYMLFSHLRVGYFRGKCVYLGAIIANIFIEQVDPIQLRSHVYSEFAIVKLYFDVGIM